MKKLTILAIFSLLVTVSLFGCKKNATEEVTTDEYATTDTGDYGVATDTAAVDATATDTMAE